MIIYKRFITAMLFATAALCFGCAEKTDTTAEKKNVQSPEMEKLVRVLNLYNRPPAIAIKSQPEQFLNFLSSLHLDRGLLTLVDKQHTLEQGYEPADLVPVTSGRTYRINRNDLRLRSGTEAALEQMALAARSDAVTLLVSSTYRTYAYQEKIYNRNVKQMGKAAADRESAMPGCSQHQLGTAIDFGSITDEYAETKAGKWLAAHAADYGFSLSFPQNMEEVTGYRWECWHYRYIGTDAVALQSQWFENVQQYMIEFLHLWYSMN